MPSPLSGVALAARDASTGELAVLVAGSALGAGSGLALDPGVGAVALIAPAPPAAARAALAALGAAGVAAATSGDGLRAVAAVDRGCQLERRSAAAAGGWAGSRADRTGSICWAAAASLLPDGRPFGALATAMAEPAPDLSARLVAALRAFERSAGDAAPARSAALWTWSGRADGGPGELRVQVDGHGRPGVALADLLAMAAVERRIAAAAEAVAAGRWADALAEASAALAVDPAAGEAWLHGGRAHLFAGRDAEGETWLRRAIELEPWLLEYLGDPSTGAPRPGVLPHRPRLIQRLAVYRDEFFRDTDFVTP